MTAHCIGLVATVSVLTILAPSSVQQVLPIRDNEAHVVINTSPTMSSRRTHFARDTHLLYCVADLPRFSRRTVVHFVWVQEPRGNRLFSVALTYRLTSQRAINSYSYFYGPNGRGFSPGHYSCQVSVYGHILGSAA